MAPRIWERALMETARLHERWDSYEPRIFAVLRSIEQKLENLVSVNDDVKQVVEDFGGFLDDLDTVLPALVQQAAGNVDGVTDGQLKALAARLPALRAGFDNLVAPAATSAPDPGTGDGTGGDAPAAGDGSTPPAGSPGAPVSDGGDPAVTATGTTDPAGVTGGGASSSS